MSERRAYALFCAVVFTPAALAVAGVCLLALRVAHA